MKVKLHKGPKHGQVLEVIRGQHNLQFVIADFNHSNFAIDNPNTFGAMKVPSRVVSYEPVFVKDPNGNMVYAMHPDGMVYFVYKG